MQRIHCPSELIIESSGGTFFISICAWGNSVCNLCMKAPILSYSSPRYTNCLFWNEKYIEHYFSMLLRFRQWKHSLWRTVGNLDHSSQLWSTQAQDGVESGCYRKIWLAASKCRSVLYSRTAEFHRALPALLREERLSPSTVEGIY